MPQARKIFGGIVLGALAGLVSNAYAQTSDLPEIGSSAGALLSPEQEYQIGLGALRSIRRQGFLVEDPLLEAYIQDVGDRLGKHADDYPGSFTFFLIRDPNVNAFAVPGGFIGVHNGLMLRAETESELAAVLAHEIVHVTQRHGARGFEAASRMSIPGAAAMLGAIALAAVSPHAGTAALATVAAGQQQVALNFTRANEREADRLGIRVLHQAEFDIDAMAGFFEKLQAAHRYSDPGFLPELLRSHPVTINRIAEAKSLATGLERRPVQESEAFALARARLAALYTANLTDLVTRLRVRLDEGAGPAENAIRYGYALTQIRAGNYDIAREQLALLNQADPGNLFYLVAIGENEFESGRYSQAVVEFSRAHDAFPGHKAPLYGLVRALLLTGEADEARQLLRDFGRGFATEPGYFQLLAETEQALGRQVESHMALAERYYWGGDNQLALQQLRIAAAQPGLGNYNEARISARQADIQKELEDMDQDGRRNR